MPAISSERRTRCQVLPVPRSEEPPRAAPKLRAALALVPLALWAAAGGAPEEVTQEQARQVAAQFLGVSPEQLRPGPFEARSEESTLAPASYDFVVVSQPREAAPWVSVNGATGEVWSMTHLAEKARQGPKGLSLEEARPIALEYVKDHWAHYDATAELQSEERFEWWQPPPGTPLAPPKRPGWCRFRWVVKEGQVEVGHAEVYVNATTGVVFDYGQWYYSTKGMPPANLTAQEAQALAWKRIPAEARSQFTPAGPPRLRTRWAKGSSRLVWCVASKQSVPITRPGEPPHIHEASAEVDAHTGEVYCGPFTVPR